MIMFIPGKGRNIYVKGSLTQLMAVHFKATNMHIK